MGVAQGFSGGRMKRILEAAGSHMLVVVDGEDMEILDLSGLFNVLGVIPNNDAPFTSKRWLHYQ